MKKKLVYIILLSLIIPCATYGQIEICNNGIDDDNDTLIDLNDDDCICEITEPVSLIANPSFEERNCCPNARSQLDCASNWIQASEPTTDFIHLCDWLGWDDFPPPFPFPDGEGIMGFRDGRVRGNNDPEPYWKEYAGHFQSHFKSGIGSYPLEVLGFCEDESKLDSIKSNLYSKMNHIKNLRLIWSKETEYIFEEGIKNYKLFMIDDKGKNKAPFTEDYIERTNATEDEFNPGTYILDFRIKKEYINQWAKMTEQAAVNNNRAIAIVLNDRVQVVPRIMDRLDTGNCSISADFSKKEANELAKSILIGQLDYKLKFTNQQVLESK